VRTDDEECTMHRNHASPEKVVTEDVNHVFASDLSFGQRLADKVSQFGGSWSFIIIFALVLVFWTLANSYVLHRPFDPYPYIFLNLLLSMLAAVQAPVIMMSQNRQAVKDRIDAANDYKVNLKAEIEIMALHEKLDQMRAEQVGIMFARQQEQIDLLTTLLASVRANGKD
jgi:uncharacterized membrane protein